MSALETGLKQLNNVQLQRVLDTPREKLIFTGAVTQGDKY